jgi:carbamoyltransferase
MKILGLSAFYHDSAASVIIDGEIIAAAQEERFTRIKHDKEFPVNAVRFCLQYSGLAIEELDAVVFYDKPLLKFERLIETYYVNAPSGLVSFVSSMMVWIKEKVFLKNIIRKELRKIEKYKKSKLKLLFTEHHLSHASSAFFASPFKEAAIVTIDGVGEWATASICRGKDNSIEILKELRFPDSLGLLYSAFTYFLGFKVNSGEYKLMGLAPYGNPSSERTLNFILLIKEKLAAIMDDGSLKLNRSYFTFETRLKMISDKKWEALFGFKRRLPDTEITQAHCDLAFAVQSVTNEIVLKMVRTAKELTGADNLCMAGGVALNCVTNGFILRSGLFSEMFIQPAAGDAGGALGAALAANYIYFGKERIYPVPPDHDTLQGAFLGPEYSNNDIELTAKKYKAVYEKPESYEWLTEKVAGLLAEGKVVGWFQGRMEFGPRALGNRSILGDARNPEMQKKLNLKIKFREGFRPFAPSVLDEDASDYFDLPVNSPYMLLVADVIKERRTELPRNYRELPMIDRLYTQRSDIPAVTHIDFSARIQTVHKHTNERYWKLICRFKEKSGYGVIVNTSFNVRGEPIVCSPEDAYICFMRTEMDHLVMGDLVFDKNLQPAWKDDHSREKRFKPD